MISTANDPVGHAIVPTVIVHTCGDVSNADRAYAERAVDHALDLLPASAWFATVDLRVEHGWARPALARVTVQHHGRIVHAHADSFTIPEAVDVLALRLRGLLDRLRELDAAKIEIAPGVTQGQRRCLPGR